MTSPFDSRSSLRRRAPAPRAGLPVPDAGALVVPGLSVGPLIGSGAWADVYAATRLDTGQDVALKVLRPQVGQDETTVRRTLQEAKLGWMLDHPNVVRVLDWGYHPGRRIFIVMERLHGETLEQRLEREKRLSIAEVLAVARAVAQGLVAIHQRAFHRDLKPSNLFVCREAAEAHVPGSRAGSSTRLGVKILDLGIAALPKDDPDRIVHTEHGEVVGTPAYAPPERFRGDAADARSDLYSLGAVLFECLLGRPPYDGTPLQIAVQACQARSAPAVQRADAPAALCALIARLLEPKPEARPGSAEEVLAALDALEERAEIQHWQHWEAQHRTGDALERLSPAPASTFEAAVLSTVLEHFHPDHIPADIQRMLEAVARLSETYGRLQIERDAALSSAAEFARRLQEQALAVEGRLRSAESAVEAQRALIGRHAERQNDIQVELDRVDAAFAARCAEFDAMTRAATERATSLAEPVDTGGQLGAQVAERLAELDGLGARRAHLARAAQGALSAIAQARQSWGEHNATAARLRQAHCAVEAEISAALAQREGEARDLAEQVDRVHQDRQHARLAIRLTIQRALFA